MANDSAGTARGEAPVSAATGLREVPDAIQWHEGMLLAPQHFQQQDARIEALLQAAVMGQSPFGWGVQGLRLDLTTLPAGQFRVRQLEAVLPDGSLACYDATAENGTLELDLHAAAAAYPNQSLRIHVAVPLRTLAAANGDYARFRSVAGAPVVDENTGEGGLEIPRLRPRLQLFAGPRPAARFCSMPIAQVVVRDGAFALDEEYAAPTPRLSPDSRLHAMCAALAQRIRTKAIALAERVRAPSVASLSPVVWEGKRQIQCLVGGLPRFEALLGCGEAHPFAVYLAMCEVAGQVTPLAASLQPPALEPYRHDELWARYATLRDFIVRTVEEGVAEAYLAIPLQQRNGAWVTHFDATWTGRRLVLGVRRGQTSSEAETANWGQQCLIASEEVLPALREKRMLGLRRQMVRPGDELISGAGVVLFELAADAGMLKPDRTLQVENAAGQAPSEVILFVRTPEG